MGQRGNCHRGKIPEHMKHTSAVSKSTAGAGTPFNFAAFRIITSASLYLPWEMSHRGDSGMILQSVSEQMTQRFHKTNKLLKTRVSFLCYALISHIACSRRQSAQKHEGNVMHGFVPLGSVGEFEYMRCVYSHAELDTQSGPCPGWSFFEE